MARKRTTPSRIVRLLLREPLTSLSAISQQISVSRSAVQKQVASLAAKGYISRPEGKKRGWVVNLRPTSD